MDSTEDELPEDVHKKLEGFDKSLGDVENILKPFLKVPIADLRDKIGDPLQNAKLDLIVAYSTNSFFWNYLITQGIDPREHPIKDEMVRIQTYMKRVQELQDKKSMSRIDTKAAKRFVRNALWQPEIASTQEVLSDVSTVISNDLCTHQTTENASKKNSEKKKRKKHTDAEKKKKRKRKKVVKN